MLTRTTPSSRLTSSMKRACGWSCRKTPELSRGAPNERPRHNDPMSELNGDRSAWLRCYRCWSQNLEIQIHYDAIRRVDLDGDLAEGVDEVQEALVQCVDCMHDQPHLTFQDNHVVPIEDRWERMVAGTPGSPPARSGSTRTGSRPARARKRSSSSPTAPSATPGCASSSPTSASTSTTRTRSSSTCWSSSTPAPPKRRPRCSKRPPTAPWRSPRWPRSPAPGPRLRRGPLAPDGELLARVLAGHQHQALELGHEDAVLVEDPGVDLDHAAVGLRFARA